MEQVLQIRCKNNKKIKNIRIGSTLSDIFNEFNLQMDFGPVSARVNNKVEGMHYRVYSNKDVEFLDLHSSSGMRTYTRTLFFILCKAVNKLFPQGSVVIDTPVSNGYYCDLRIGREVTAEDVDAIREEMQHIIEAHIPIHRHECTTEEAIRLFEEKGAPSKVKLLKSTGNIYTVYYDIAGYYDYYYGTLLTNTADIHLFGL